MAEMTVGREMDAAVAEAVGLVCREIHAPEWGFNVPTPCWVVKDITVPSNWAYVRVENWHPSTSDADAFAALDAVLALPRWRQVCVEIVNLVNAHGTNGWCVRLYYSPEEQRGYIERLGATRAEAICKAILALAETDHV